MLTGINQLAQTQRPSTMLVTGVHHLSYEERLHAAAGLPFSEFVRCWADLIIIIIISPHTLDCQRS